MRGLIDSMCACPILLIALHSVMPVTAEPQAQTHRLSHTLDEALPRGFDVTYIVHQQEEIFVKKVAGYYEITQKIDGDSRTIVVHMNNVPDFLSAFELLYEFEESGQFLTESEAE